MGVVDAADGVAPCVDVVFEEIGEDFVGRFQLEGFCLACGDEDFVVVRGASPH